MLSSNYAVGVDMMDLQLKGKKVLVTGGSRGIGKAIAAAFQQEGAMVGAAARNKEELYSVQKELGIQTYEKDLSVSPHREQLMEAFIQDFHRIDVLVNNIGAGFGGPPLSTPYTVYEDAMNVNFTIAVHMSQLASSYMVANESGSIINISSIYGREAGGTSAYNASKAALNSFTKSFSSEMIKYNVRVNGIAPGAVYHPNEIWKRRLQADPHVLEKYAKKNIPAGRLGKPEEIGNAAVFLASDKAYWIVGSTINVDGGQSHLNF